MIDLQTAASHTLEKAFEGAGSSELGLESPDARRRLAVYGPNQLLFHQTPSPLLMLLKEFASLFPLLLLSASLLSFLANRLNPDNGYDLIGYALLGVVVLNALVSFLQNYKVRKLMASFLEFIPKQVVLLRDGRKVMIDAREVVPGDLLYVQEGDKIPADGVLIRASQLLADESVLTGESLPVQKMPLGEGKKELCIVFSGSTVLKGGGQMLVIRTGRATNIGAISMLSQRVQQDLTPMQKELREFIRKITAIAMATGVLFFVIGLMTGHSILNNLVFAIGIIVANVPEGLLPMVTLTLTRSSLRMSRQNAVIKDILSVETLGSTTVICTDKTGTLTRNLLQVERLYFDAAEILADNPDAFRRHRTSGSMCEIMLLCNDLIPTVNARGTTEYKGDPTELAMVEFVERLAGQDSIRDRFETIETRPFDVKTRYMSTIVRKTDGGLLMMVKGAPESVLERCGEISDEGVSRRMTTGERRAIEERAEAFAGEGLRVLALALKPVEHTGSAADHLVFAGLVALSDPPRPEVPGAVSACMQAGIRIIVMSGDKGETVASLTKSLGIALRPRVIEGSELSKMGRDRLVELLRHEEIVFARIAPEQKLEIVNALKEMGEVVAMTGDGVNDAPALKRADIGIAMGLRGTDVAREASDIILLDDNFATIVKAVEEGRCVYENIRKFIVYVLTSNVPEIVPYIAYVLLPVPLAITVVQMLCIDLFTDMLPAIGLGNEAPEPDNMQRPPRAVHERLVTLGTFAVSYGFIGPVETLLSYLIFFSVLFDGGWRWGQMPGMNDPLYAQAAGSFLATVIFSQIGNVMACRSSRQSAIPLLKRVNAWILAGIALEVAFIMTITNVEAFNRLFTTAPIDATTWLRIMAAPFAVLGVDELRKLVTRSLSSRKKSGTTKVSGSSAKRCS